MTARDFDDGALMDAWGSRPPADIDRTGRVDMVAEVFECLLDGRMPSRRAALFVAGGGLQWLRDGGSLERTYWRISGPAGSHRTASWVYRSSRGQQDSESRGEMDAGESTNTEDDRDGR